MNNKRTEYSTFKAWASKYTIKKGRHRHSRWFSFRFFTRKSTTFQFAFSRKCLYSIKGNDEFDLNKMAGFSDSWNHHKSSARLGWRCLDGKTIELHTYTYNKGVREKERHLLTVKPEEICSCEIEDLGDKWKFTVCNYTSASLAGEEIPKTKNKWPINYRLYPYFGGNIPAPLTMHIWLSFIR